MRNRLNMDRLFIKKAFQSLTDTLVGERKLNVCLVIDGEFEATKSVNLNKNTTASDEIVHEYLRSSSRKSITRFDKEKLTNLCLNKSEQSIENFEGFFDSSRSKT